MCWHAPETLYDRICDLKRGTELKEIQLIQKWMQNERQLDAVQLLS